MALQMKAACETCQAPLGLDGDACICSFECTFCVPCTRDIHDHACPNCAGELVARPKRSAQEGTPQ